ncbi:MAG: PD-(D/E)XK nuclease family protein [Rubrobacteraceae bacterium]|nr:PD-(D/E)XK nuclease family protein [Rubrobacteraceae bacterium]
MVDAATKLLDDFKKLPGRVERPRTFMEIAGYPHYENVCSNILAFFMDPEESHGLGTLVLDALTSVGNDAEADTGIGGSISVEREVGTDRGRIDILITSDDHAILIENKIHAGVSNPFDDYDAHLDYIAEGREKLKFLLTLYPTDEGSEWDFKNLTHEEFVGQIRSLLGRYVSDANTRYLTMFLDFLNTLENLRRETRMNPEFVHFLAERRDDIRRFFDDLKDFRNELRSKVQELESMINVSQHKNVNQNLWRGPTVNMSDVLYQDISLSRDLPVAIDTVVSPHGWRIQIFVRRGGNKSKLRDLLQHLEIPFEENGRFTHTEHFAYDEDLNRISPILQNIVDKLATSQELKA